jgi:glycosyltransferase involved in cell wall biosynthesis
MKLSILMPVYNERRTLREIVSRVLAQEVHGVDEVGVIIVDDCSTDGSADIIRQLQAEHPETLHSILLEENQGKGNAIRLAIQAASGDIGHHPGCRP